MASGVMREGRRNNRGGSVDFLVFRALRSKCRFESLLPVASGSRAHRFKGMESGAHLQALDLAVQQTRDGQYLRAIERFESALESGMADLNEAKRQALMSYYGVCVAMVWGRTAQPLEWCHAAVGHGPVHPDLQHNLAMVLLRANRRREAVQALEKGARSDPDHEGIKATFQRLTRRRKLLIPFLGRKHFLNRSLGHLLTRTGIQH